MNILFQTLPIEKKRMIITRYYSNNKEKNKTNNQKNNKEMKPYFTNKRGNFILSNYLLARRKQSGSQSRSHLTVSTTKNKTSITYNN